MISQLFVYGNRVVRVAIYAASYPFLSAANLLFQRKIRYDVSL